MGTIIELLVAPAHFPLGLMALLAKATFVLAAAGVAALVISRRTAAAAHVIWTASLTGALCLPLLQLTLPGWTVPWLQLPLQTLPAGSAASAAGVSAASPDRSAALGRDLQDAADGIGTRSLVHDETAGTEQPPTSGAAARPSATDETLWQAGREWQPTRGSVNGATTSEADSLRWQTYAWLSAALLYLGGVLFLTWRRGREILHLARMISGASPATAPVLKRADRLAREIGLSTRLVIGIDRGARMPLAWWNGCWAILLPAEFESWPAAEQDTVLLHELMHIKRRDAWADLLAQGACCVYWFHPLVWWAAAEMRHLREQAADDLVVQSGLMGANQYARQLVDVVARCPGPVPTGVAMARPHELERRVHRIVLGARTWRPLSPVTSLAVFASGLVLVGLLASAQLRASPGTSPGSRSASADDTATRGTATHDTVADSRPAIASIRATGRVVDANGTAIAHARVFVRAWSNHVPQAGLVQVDDVLAEARTDAEGRFRFQDVPLTSHHRQILRGMRRDGKGLDLVAQADGYGLAFMHLPSLASDEERVLRLTEEREVRGVVQGPEGRPIAGADVVLIGISKVDTLLDPFLHSEHEIALARSQIRLATTTDLEGQFQLGGLPRGSRAHLGIDHPRYLSQRAIVATDPDADSTMLESNHSPTPDQPLQVSPATIELETGHPIRMQILDEATGRPLPGGNFAVIHRSSERTVYVDEDGVAELSLSSVGTQIALYRAPRGEGEAGLGVQRQIEVQDVTELQEFELRIPARWTLEGRVVDDAGQGVAGAAVRWFQQGSADELSFFSQAATRGDGRFAVPVTSGEGRLTVSEAPPGFYSPSSRELRDLPEGEAAMLRPTVDVPETGEVPPVEIRIPYGLVVEGQVIDAAGEPVAGARVIAEPAGLTQAPSATVTADESGRYRLAGLHPREPYTMRVASPAGGAARSVEGAPEHRLSASRTVKMDIQLGPTLSLVGRVFLGEEPVAGVVVQLNTNQPIGEVRWKVVPVDRVETDSDGWYRLTGLLPGERYQVEVSPDMAAYDPTWIYASPHFHEAPERIAGEIELPEMHLVPLTQTLAGVVVDPDGNPVAGATVGARLEGGASLSRRSNGPAPRTETDQQGRFRLEQLPEFDLQLMAYVRPTGPDRRIRYPAQVDVDRNQQDIRVVLDPSLAEDE